MHIQPVSELEPEAVYWLWLWRLGLGKLALLEGDPGVGKSLVSLDLCARLSRPKTTRAIWDAGVRLGLSKRTMQRAQEDLNVIIKQVREDGVVRTYWLLPGQELPARTRRIRTAWSRGCVPCAKNTPASPLDEAIDPNLECGEHRRFPIFLISTRACANQRQEFASQTKGRKSESGDARRTPNQPAWIPIWSAASIAAFRFS